MIGSALSHYRVVEKIGEGGMGEVYRARDTKLDRDVAIKVLPAEFATDAERAARFEREAKLLASLNHPSVATLHGFEQHEGTRFLVMELVEGPTLADQLQRGPASIDQVVPWFISIAEGLQAAHDKGIVHRDLKPANIKVAAGGRVKILDFGLAKAYGMEAQKAGASESPTLTKGTALGVILGTASYMSPEQARGDAVDARTDVWAFGCCLYEALTGRAAFLSRTVPETIAKILEREPDWDALPPTLSTGIRRVLRRCLVKDPTRRYRDVWGARLDIEEALDDPAIAPSTGGRMVAAGLAVALGLLAVAMAIWTTGERHTEQQSKVRRLVIDLPEEQALTLRGVGSTGGAQPSVAISPNGSNVVYVGEREGSSILYVRPIDSFEATAVAGTEGAFHPFFSPDGEWLGFFAGAELKKVPASGGQPRTLCEARGPRGASWSSDGWIYFSEQPRLARVPEDGGAPEEVHSGAYYRWPHAPPDQSWILDGGVAVVFPESGARQRLFGDGEHPRFVPTGHLVYNRAGTLTARTFDPDRLEVSASPIPVLEGLRSEFSGAAQYAFSLDGTLAYVPGEAARGKRLVWVNRSGEVTPLEVPPGDFSQFQISPDGTRVAAGLRGATWDVWIYDLIRGTRVRMTTEGVNSHVVWSADAQWLAFSSYLDGRNHLVRMRADGSGAAEQLFADDVNLLAYSWSADGRWLAFNRDSPRGDADVWVLPTTGERTPTEFVATPFHDSLPAFSPDGQWMAYVSTESGDEEVYVQPFPEGGRTWAVSSGGGTEPVWSRAGQELFYRRGNAIMAVEFAVEPDFSPGAPRQLFAGSFVDAPGRAYDVSPDGERFLMLEDVRDSRVTKIHVIVNWFEELERLVPTNN